MHVPDSASDLSNTATFKQHCARQDSRNAITRRDTFNGPIRSSMIMHTHANPAHVKIPLLIDLSEDDEHKEPLSCFQNYDLDITESTLGDNTEKLFNGQISPLYEPMEDDLQMKIASTWSVPDFNFYDKQEITVISHEIESSETDVPEPILLSVQQEIMEARRSYSIGNEYTCEKDEQPINGGAFKSQVRFAPHVVSNKSENISLFVSEEETKYITSVISNVDIVHKVRKRSPTKSVENISNKRQRSNVLRKRKPDSELNSSVPANPQPRKRLSIPETILVQPANQRKRPPDTKETTPKTKLKKKAVNTSVQNSRALIHSESTRTDLESSQVKKGKKKTIYMKKRGKDDAQCPECRVWFLGDKEGAEWLECLCCSMWVHQHCAPVDDYCNKCWLDI